MNFIVLNGRLTAKPELRVTTTNRNYSRFTLAVNRPKQKDKEQETDFINCIAWGKTGETIAKYFDKGSPIMINGSIRVTTYEKEGQKRTSTDVVINDFEFVGSKQKNEDDVWEEFGNDIDNFLE